MDNSLSNIDKFRIVAAKILAKLIGYFPGKGALDCSDIMTDIIDLFENEKEAVTFFRNSVRRLESMGLIRIESREIPNACFHHVSITSKGAEHIDKPLLINNSTKTSLWKCLSMPLEKASWVDVIELMRNVFQSA
jgi:hypothetical protein